MSTLSNLALLEEIVRASFQKGILAQKFSKVHHGSKEWRKLDEEIGIISLTLGELEVEYMTRFAPEALEMLDQSVKENKENK